ncbi:MAG: ATP-grasp domain-containing protein [Smithellaceae bacterium]
MEMPYKISVLITGVGGGGNGEQILKALRMAEKNYEIIGCDISQYSKGLKYVDIPYIVPRPNDPRYLETIIEICRKHAVKALIPGSEPELLFLSRNREKLLAEKIFLPVNPESVIETCMNKSKTFEFFEKNNFLFPETKLLQTLDDARTWNIFPAILKPSVGSGGSSHTYIAQNKDDLTMLSKYMLEGNICLEIIIQEYVGTPESEYTVGVLFDMDGNFINSIAVKRDLSLALSRRISLPNRTEHKKFGPNLVISSGISQGEIGHFPEVTSKCEEIAAKLGTCGPTNIQCRLYKGDVYVFEINPRFSGTTSLRAMVGYNEPDVLIRKHLLGENIQPRFPYKSGIIVRGLDETYFDTGGMN